MYYRVGNSRHHLFCDRRRRAAQIDPGMPASLAMDSAAPPVEASGAPSPLTTKREPPCADAVSPFPALSRPAKITIGCGEQGRQKPRPARAWVAS